MSELIEGMRVAFLVVMAPGMLWVDQRWDQPEGRIPAPIALTVLGAGLGLALITRDWTGLILWPAFFLGWRAGGVGAGDAKVWMGLAAAGGIGPSAVGLVALVALARLRAWRMGWGWRAGLAPRVRVPMSAPTAGWALAAALTRIALGG